MIARIENIMAQKSGHQILAIGAHSYGVGDDLNEYPDYFKIILQKRQVFRCC